MTLKILALFIILCGFTTNVLATEIEAATQANCQAKGGAWKKALAKEFCDIPSKNEGKTCYKKSDCGEDICIVDNNAKNAVPPKGKCSGKSLIGTCDVGVISEKGQVMTGCID